MTATEPRPSDHDSLRALVAAYAHSADRREPEAVAALFTDDGVLAIYEGDPDRVAPARERRGRVEIATAIAKLARYEVTTHFLGQQTFVVSGDAAIGESYCIAHHLADVGGRRHDHVLSIRYLDRCCKIDGAWCFAERRLVIDWTDERTITA